MANSKTLFKDFIDSIKAEESRSEIESIASITFESLFGLSKVDILAEREIHDQKLIDRLSEVTARLNQHEPIQYILGEALFFGRCFRVNKSVLIPRPETEELVRVVATHIRKRNRDLKMVDVGTGSGCIAITLAKEFPGCDVIATDISSEALEVAAANANKFDTTVRFVQHNILVDKILARVDVIVSNPPYIPANDRHHMQEKVVAFEPDIALFVDSNDPFIFYHALLLRAKESLLPGGLLAVEINERFGKEIFSFFCKHDLHEIEIIKDVYGKERIVKGIVSS
jgi:release factor glutamine methyltransferase